LPYIWQNFLFFIAINLHLTADYAVKRSFELQSAFIESEDLPRRSRECLLPCLASRAIHTSQTVGCPALRKHKKRCPYGQVLLIFHLPDRHLFGQSLTVCQGRFGGKCRGEELGGAAQTTLSYLTRRSPCIA
jgi:hypothetical protein